MTSPPYLRPSLQNVDLKQGGSFGLPRTEPEDEYDTKFIGNKLENKTFGDPEEANNGPTCFA